MDQTASYTKTCKNQFSILCREQQIYLKLPVKEYGKFESYNTGNYNYISQISNIQLTAHSAILMLRHCLLTLEEQYILLLVYYTLLHLILLRMAHISVEA